jgi:hypothetical protein
MVAAQSLLSERLQGALRNSRDGVSQPFAVLRTRRRQPMTTAGNSIPGFPASIEATAIAAGTAEGHPMAAMFNRTELPLV